MRRLPTASRPVRIADGGRVDADTLQRALDDMHRRNEDAVAAVRELQVGASSPTGARSTDTGQLMCWGATQIHPDDPSYLAPGHSENSIPDDFHGLPIQRDCVLRDLRVRHNAGPGNKSVTYDVLVDGAETGISVVELDAGSVGLGQDLSHTFAVGAGQALSLRATPNSGITDGTLYVQASLRLT